MVLYYLNILYKVLSLTLMSIPSWHALQQQEIHPQAFPCTLSQKRPHQFYLLERTFRLPYKSLRKRNLTSELLH